jgi:hypothetical protein
VLSEGCAAPDGLLVFVDFAFVFAIVLSPASLRGAGLAAPRFPPPVFVRTRTACISAHERVQQVQRYRKLSAMPHLVG